MKYTILAILVYLQQKVLLTNAHSTLADGYTLYPEVRKSYKLHTEPQPWSEAFLKCFNEKARLAHPKNEQESKYIKSIAKKVLPKKQCSIFLGFHDKFSPRHYNVITGESLKAYYHEWKKRKPTKKPGENCGTMCYTDGKISVISCTELLPFVCEKDMKEVEDYRCDSAISTCYKVHQVKRTWGEAEIICQSEGGHLAVVKSAHVGKLLTQFVKDLKILSFDFKWDMLVLVGFHQLFSDSVWLSMEGQSIESYGYSQLLDVKSRSMRNSKGEKIEGGDEGPTKCGAMDEAGHITGYPCTVANYFICEKPQAGKT